MPRFQASSPLMPCFSELRALIQNPDQHARGDQHAIGGQVETANVKKSGEHVGLDAPNVS
jgi:hypothetical protein